MAEKSTMEFILDTMLSDMEQADTLYRPTNFWSSGLPSIIDELRSKGFERFREHDSAHLFYVPLHSRIVWRKHKRTVRSFAKLLDGLLKRKGIATRVSQMLDGTYRAFEEYRLFQAGNDPSQRPCLTDLGESNIGGGERFEIDGNLYGKSFLNYLRGLAFLKKHTDVSQLSTILEIGGGYGTLGEILLKSVPDGFYINVDIPPLAAVSTYYLQQVFGKDAVLSYDETRSFSEIDLTNLKKSYRAVVLCPWQLPKVVGGVDAFMNFMSFQEMEPDIVKNYAGLVQPLTRDVVLLRNSTHGKSIARKAGEIGVIRATTNDSTIEMFDQFRVIGRDSVGYGEETPDRSFRSELVCMVRQT